MLRATPVPAASGAANARGRTRLGHLLSHPLVLLLLGAAISAVIVPMLTQRWQDHQRALDIQTSLVADMTEASETYREALAVDELIVRYPQGRGTPASRAARRAISDLTRTGAAWQVRWAVITSRLRAYYPGAPIVHRWARLSAALASLYDGVPGAGAVQLRILGRTFDLTTDVGFDGALVAVGSYRDQIVQQVLNATPRV